MVTATKPKEPPRRRARLDTTAKINLEIARNYRKLADGKMTPAAAARQVATLVALRSGMPDVPARKPDFTPAEIRIFSVPSSCFLNLEQIRSVKEGVPIVDIAQCEPFTFEPAAPIVSDDGRRDNVRPLRMLEGPIEPDTSQSKLLAELEGLSDEQLRERALACGLDPSLLNSSLNASSDPSKS
jgi:hypothetical protein